MLRDSTSAARKKDASTLITIRKPWQGAATAEQYLLVLRDDAEAPSDFEGQIVKAPVRRVVCMSSSHVAMFDAVGQVRRVAGVSGIDYISNPYVREHRLCGEVRDVGYDTNLDFELLAAMRPDIILLYGVTGENTVITGKLRELNIPYIHRRLRRRVAAGQSRMARCRRGLCDLRQAGADTLRRIARDYEALRSQPAPGGKRRR